MNFAKNIFLIIISPTQGWKEVKKFNVPKDILLEKVFYPLLGVNAITSFISYFYNDSLTLSNYIINAVISCSKYLFGYLIAAFILQSIFSSIANEKDGNNKINEFSIYIFTILMIFGILNNLLPSSLNFVQVLPLYLIFVIWKSSLYFDIPKEISLKFFIISCIAFLVPPYLIEYLLSLLIA